MENDEEEGQEEEDSERGRRRKGSLVLQGDQGGRRGGVLRTDDGQRADVVRRGEGKLEAREQEAAGGGEGLSAG